jgi:DNA adenine methylase
MISPALRYHGGKYRLAPWIIDFFPKHECYVESFGGAAGVLLQKPRSYAEVYNDLDGQVVNFFRVIRDPETRQQLISALERTPYARAEFEAAKLDSGDDPIEQARCLAIKAWMGFGSAGATKKSTGFRIYTKKMFSLAMKTWSDYPNRLDIIGERFGGVLIENRPAVEVILKHDTPETLHYVDPPYMFRTRFKGADREGIYQHEMSDDEHVELLDTLNGLKGYVVLSGYESDIYNDKLQGWQKHTTEARVSMSRGTGIKTECLWINPACAEALEREHVQLSLFAEAV